MAVEPERICKLSSIKAIAYISRTNKEFSPQDLDHLLIEARNFNQAHAITGVLLHNPGFFYQYLEGPEHTIHEVYARIEAAHSHQIVMEVFNNHIDKRYCSDWHMGFCRVPQGCIQELAHLNWVAKVPEVKHYSSLSLGLQMMLTFWNNMASKAA